MKNIKVQSDSGNGSDGSNEASTENSEDENIAVASEVWATMSIFFLKKIDEIYNLYMTAKS